MAHRQHHAVEVTFLVYQGRLHAEALALVAAKMHSALMVEGELPEDGLAALEGGGQDVFLALARQLTEESGGRGQLLETLFPRRRLGTTSSGTSGRPRLQSGYLAWNRRKANRAKPLSCGSRQWPRRSRAHWERLIPRRQGG